MDRKPHFRFTDRTAASARVGSPMTSALIIRQLHELGKDGLADVLIDLEAHDAARGRVIAALRRVT